VYFTVDDADQVAGQATKLGGKICMPLMDIPEIGPDGRRHVAPGRELLRHQVRDDAVA
jgi:hypothetical protein